MYSPRQVARTQAALEALPPIKAQFPQGIPRTSVADCVHRQAILDRIRPERDKYGNPEGPPTRALTEDEDRFIAAERLLVKSDFRYACERYIKVNKGGTSLEPLYPLWESQEMFLRALAKLEDQIADGTRHDGIFLRGLKARQLGWSTFSQALLAHRTLTHAWTVALLASDTPDGSDGLFDMQERIVETVPWYLRPTITERQKNDEIVYDTGSRVIWAAGRSTRGQSKEAGGQGAKGQLGRGKTIACSHLSEISTWDNPEQIRGAFYPAVPRHKMIVVIEESSPKGRHNYWHHQWLAAVNGTDDRRAEPVFVGSYAEPKKYSWPPPAGWSPTTETLSYARRVETDAPRWMGHSLTLTRPQLYWYEQTRAAYDANDELSIFLEEFASDPEECFQYSGRSVFSLAVRSRIKAAMKNPVAIWAVTPSEEIARLRAFQREASA